MHNFVGDSSLTKWRDNEACQRCQKQMNMPVGCLIPCPKTPLHLLKLLMKRMLYLQLQFFTPIMMCAEHHSSNKGMNTNKLQFASKFPLTLTGFGLHKVLVHFPMNAETIWPMFTDILSTVHWTRFICSPNKVCTGAKCTFVSCIPLPSLNRESKGEHYPNELWHWNVVSHLTNQRIDAKSQIWTNIWKISCIFWNENNQHIKFTVVATTTGTFSNGLLLFTHY